MTFAQRLAAEQAKAESTAKVTFPNGRTVDPTVCPWDVARVRHVNTHHVVATLKDIEYHA